MKNSLKPFVKELLISVMVISIVVLTVIYELFTTELKFNIISLAFIVSLIVLLLCTFKSVKIGILALLDFLFEKKYELNGIMQAQIPYEAGWFSDKFDKDSHIRSSIRYCVVIKIDDCNVSLISSQYIDVNIGEFCTLLIGKHSGIILNEVTSITD